MLASIQFNFSSSSVSLKENQACGAHRGVKCSFDGSYPRKKEAKPKTPVETKTLMIVSCSHLPMLNFPLHVNNLIKGLNVRTLSMPISRYFVPRVKTTQYEF
jgi:hypothetical protein